MTQLSIKALFDGQPVLSIVAGEDRSIAVSLTNMLTQLPYDLTYCDVSIGLPRVGGGTIRRTSAPYVGAHETVVLNTTTTGVIVIPGHGFVSGDIVTFATASAGAALPSPLTAGTAYTLQVIDNNLFSLTDITGGPVVLTAPGAGFFSVSEVRSNLVITNAQLGLLTLTLPGYVTSQLQALIGQSFQLNISTGGLQRIVLCDAALDVSTQPAP